MNRVLTIVLFIVLALIGSIIVLIIVLVIVLALIGSIIVLIIVLTKEWHYQ